MGGILTVAAGHVRAESLTTPVHKITDAGVDKELGSVVFTDDGKGGVDILVEMTGLPPGPHGMHIHENPSCAPAPKDGKNVAGLAAGGHFDPAHSGRHEGPGKPGHKGDLPFIRRRPRYGQGQAARSGADHCRPARPLVDDPCRRRQLRRHTCAAGRRRGAHSLRRY